ncbi:hypothetical protein BD289DRAFT_28659 [Coniella lustricola]|uniref:Uncharacterized protein n=1 Tax=Coniella lustricola TaxID=2025994 RepID=A0A2T3AJ19_9PEZI|nr:hypothetical protein BD289DRAFT_28659 [Coniella lustricola]
MSFRLLGNSVWYKNTSSWVVPLLTLRFRRMRLKDFHVDTSVSSTECSCIDHVSMCCAWAVCPAWHEHPVSPTQCKQTGWSQKLSCRVGYCWRCPSPYSGFWTPWRNSSTHRKGTGNQKWQMSLAFGGLGGKFEPWNMDACLERPQSKIGRPRTGSLTMPRPRLGRCRQMPRKNGRKSFGY